MDILIPLWYKVFGFELWWGCATRSKMLCWLILYRKYKHKIVFDWFCVYNVRRCYQLEGQPTVIKCLINTWGRAYCYDWGNKGGYMVEGYMTHIRYVWREYHYYSRSTIHFAKNQVYHEGSRCIGISLHFVRDIISAREIWEEIIPIE